MGLEELQKPARPPQTQKHKTINWFQGLSRKSPDCATFKTLPKPNQTKPTDALFAQHGPVISEMADT
ncbi:hypothetical protein LEMLEM_LOCUS18785 [Lemmus lemmus]